MTGLLFVTAQSTDVKDLNRILLYLRDWDISVASSTPNYDTVTSAHSADPELFIDRFRFVTKHNPKTLISQRSSASHAATHGTFPPVPPSATFVNSWVGQDVEQIEQFVDTFASGLHDEGRGSPRSSDNGAINRRDSGYSSTGSIAGADEPSQGYNTDMYLVVDEAGLATGTATLACRRHSTSQGSTGSAWDRVRGVPWAEVCSTWKAVKTGSVEVLLGGQQKRQGPVSSAGDGAGSRWLDYKRPVDDRMVSAPRDCRRRDLEVSMWHECGLV